MTAIKRPRPPTIRQERDALLWQFMGCTRAEVDLDHDPALVLRDYDEATGLYTPDAYDITKLVFRIRPEHKVKTFGRGGTKRITVLGSDLGERDKTRDLIKKEAEFRARCLARKAGEPKPKSKWASRPFQKRRVKP